MVEIVVLWSTAQADAAHAPAVLKATKPNAYATMRYMGIPREFKFYVAATVMLRSLKTLK
jgi:hypothetical protein